MTKEITNILQVASLKFEDEKDRASATQILAENARLKDGEKPTVMKLHISRNIVEIRVFRYNKNNWRYEFIDYFPIKEFTEK